MSEIVVYSTSWCCDCRRAKQFLRERGVTFREVNIDEAPDAEELVVRVNNGKRKVPTLEVDGRYFACSPFDPHLLADELKIPLNPRQSNPVKKGMW
jgi:mycoredoxin